jgi:hypothetical protein
MKRRYKRDQEDMKEKIELETRCFFFTIKNRREETTRSSTLQTKTC